MGEPLSSLRSQRHPLAAPLTSDFTYLSTRIFPVQVKTEGGKIIRVEAHPIPEHPRPRRAQGRVALVGDAAGYVTKCSGEGIYFAAKSGRMCAEAIVEASKNGARALPLGFALSCELLGRCCGSF